MAGKSVPLPGKTLEGSVGRECPLGGILSPLLWGLVEDELTGLNENGCNTMGYADNIATLTRGKFLKTISEILQEALSMIQE
jgi:hypothetical protein